MSMWKRAQILVACVLAVAAIVITSGMPGCATPVEISPTLQPGGITTPRITPVFPPTRDIQELPPGFVPCGSYVAPITLDDGSVVNMLICVYCSTDPNNPTVYVQQNCEGPYKKGIRNPQPGKVAPAPKAVEVYNLGGSLDLVKSKITFQIGEDVCVDPDILRNAPGVVFNVGGVDVRRLSIDRGKACLKRGSMVTLQGHNEDLANILYWQFGVGYLAAEAPLLGLVELRIGHNDMTGITLCVSVNGGQPEPAGLIGWSTN